MSKRLKYVIDFDFTTYDNEITQDDLEALKCELFEDMSAVLSRLVDKYETLVGFKQGVFIEEVTA